MSKTFEQVKTGDEMYIIKGNNVKIVKVQNAEVSDERYMLIAIGDTEYSLPIDLSSFYDDILGDIYCNIDEAIKEMKKICENALHAYTCARGALNQLETKKKAL